MLHKYASESKWEDAIRLCRFVKVKLRNPLVTNIINLLHEVDHDLAEIVKVEVYVMCMSWIT